MKIIQIMDNFSVGGGVNSFVYDLCRAMKEQNYDVSLIGIIDNGYNNNPQVEALMKNGIRVECIGANSKSNALIKCIGKLRNKIIEISAGEPTVCNLHLKLSVLMGGLASIKLKNVICVETYHSLYHNYWLENRLMSPFIKHYIACSESAKDEFIMRFHPNSERITAIPNGVNRAALRKQVAGNTRNDRKITAISVGRFTNQKNLHITAEAFAGIDNENFEYKIFGCGECEEKIRDAANGNTNVKLCGPVQRNEIINELANSAIVVMPSLWEGLSIFMLEAMAMDCPMMISDVRSLRDVFHEKELRQGESWRACSWGYLVATSNIQAYREAMLDFLTNRLNDEKIRDSVKIYSKEYDISKTALSYLQVYNSIWK